MDLKPEFKYILEHCEAYNTIKDAIGATSGTIPECLNPTIPEKPANPDEPGAAVVSEDVKEKMLFAY